MGMEIPRHWRLKKQRYGLVGEICPHCEKKIFPPRDVCPYCGGEPRATIVAIAQDKDGGLTTILANRALVASE